MLKLVISPNARNSIASFLVVGHLNKQANKKNLYFLGVVYLHATYLHYVSHIQTSPRHFPSNSASPIDYGNYSSANKDEFWQHCSGINSVQALDMDRINTICLDSQET